MKETGHHRHIRQRKQYGPVSVTDSRLKFQCLQTDVEKHKRYRGPNGECDQQGQLGNNEYGKQCKRWVAEQRVGRTVESNLKRMLSVEVIKHMARTVEHHVR